MEYNKSASCSLMDIPVEIRAMILKEVTQPTAFNLRLVSQQFKKEIEAFYNFEIHLDDREPQEDMEQRLNLRIHSCIVDHLLKPINMQDNNPIFKHPRALKSMVFNLNGINLTLANYHILLQQCAPYLKNLCLKITYAPLRSEHLDGKYPPTNVDNPCHFANLETLSIFDPPCEYDSTCYKITNYLLLHLFFNTISSKLRKLDLTVFSGASLQLTFAYQTALISYISKHFTTLKEISLYAKYISEDGEGEVVQKSQVEFSYRGGNAKVINLNNLKTLVLHFFDYKLGPHYDAEAKVGKEIMKTFVQNKEKLKHLEVMLEEFQMPLLQQIIWRSEDTLQIVILERMKFRLDGNRLDMTVLQECVNLKALHVSHDKMMQEVILDIVNFQPQNSLEKLELIGFRMLEFELRQWLADGSIGLKCLMLKTLSNGGVDLKDGELLKALFPNLVKVQIMAITSLIY